MNVGRVISLCVHSAVFKNITTLKCFKQMLVYFNFRMLKQYIISDFNVMH